MQTNSSITMRYFTPASSDMNGGDYDQRSVDSVPTGMEKDPRADEEVIDQDTDGEYPEPVKKPEEAKLAPDNLTDSIAYALDGSGPGPTNEKPNVSGHDVVTEGTTGAGPEEEDALFEK